MLKGKCEPKSPARMSARLFVYPAVEFLAEECFEHPLRVSIAWSDTIRRGMTPGVIHLLRNRYQDLAAKKPDGLVLLFGLSRVEAKTNFLELTIDPLPACGFFEHLNPLANLLWREYGSTGDLLQLDEGPAVGCQFPVVHHDKLPCFIRIWPDNWMNGLTEKPKQLFVRCAKKIETGVVEHPVVFPISPVDTVLVDVAGCVAKPVVR